MKFLAAFALSVAIPAVVAQSQPAAPLATNQPPRMSYQAILQSDKPVQGTITGVAADNGTGVVFNIGFYNFPDTATLAPFAYHIHVDQVVDGNCTSAGGHLRPFGGPDDTVTCDPAQPQFCQVGDLSGKHGKITVDSLVNGQKYIKIEWDPYVSAIEGSEAFFGNRSIVVHDKNGNRINCANFVLSGGASNGTSPADTTTSSASSTATGTGAASGSSSGMSTGTATSSQPATTSYHGEAAGRLLRDVSWAGIALLGVSAAMIAA